ncbi:hypothetical protein ACQR35_10935 [Pseudarthrobacter sp. J1738]|uniref:hypothetical protein n=1 Tax=Pseudarthrobacter sp. J1738 TaxID=3420446 RepID=UPI003D2E0340
MSYVEALTGLGAATEAKAVTIFELFQAGQLTKAQTVATMASLISKANLQAASLADLSLAATLTLQTGAAVPATGITIRSGSVLVARGIREILDTPPKEADMLMRIQRIARTAPIDSGARAYSKAIKSQPRVQGWTRGLSPKACQLCRWWWRDGQVFSASKSMAHHPGCTCIQIPTVKEK